MGKRCSHCSHGRGLEVMAYVDAQGSVYPLMLCLACREDMNERLNVRREGNVYRVLAQAEAAAQGR